MDSEMVTLEDAKTQVRVTVQRLALLHLAYTKTLVKEFGEEKGKQLILNAIKEYGLKIAERTKNGSQSLPKYGFHQKHEGDKTYGCELALLLLEYGEEELGKLYCYVDPAKSMGADPNTKMIHTKCLFTGDSYCSFETVPTTEKEREDFFGKHKDWSYLDPILIKGERK